MSDSVRDEFLAEAQEIIESLSRDLLLLDQAQKDAGGDPTFRAQGWTLPGPPGRTRLALPPPWP